MTGHHCNWRCYPGYHVEAPQQDGASGGDPVVARIVQKLYGEPELTGIQLDWDLATISAVALVIGDVVDDYRSSTLPGLRGAVSSEDIPLLEQALRDLESVVES